MNWTLAIIGLLGAGFVAGALNALSVVNQVSFWIAAPVGIASISAGLVAGAAAVFITH